MILEIRSNKGVYVAEFKKEAAIEVYKRLQEDEFHFKKQKTKSKGDFFKVLKDCNLSLFDGLLIMTLFEDYYIKIKL